MANENYIDVLENSLNIELKPNEVLKFDFTHEILSKLGSDLKSYYKNTPLPHKEISTIRPYLSPNYSIGKKLHFHVSSHYSSGFRFNFDRNQKSPVIDLCKSHLLYAHSICFEDPLVYLLDYFDNLESEYSRSRIPAVQAVLFDYARMRSLIRSNIVTLHSIERGGRTLMNDIILTSEQIDLLSGKTSHKHEVIKGIYSDILEDLDQIKRLDNRIDLYFPDKIYSEIYLGLLKVLQESFVPQTFREPFYSGLIGSIDGINIDAVSLEDLVNIRKNEEAFGLWRKFTKEILQELYNEEGQYSNSGLAFKEFSKDKFGQIDPIIKKSLHGSSVLGEIISAGQQSAIGFVVGAAAGGVLNVPSATSMFTGAFSPWIKLIIDTLRSGLPNSKNLAINNHFMVYNLK